MSGMTEEQRNNLSTSRTEEYEDLEKNDSNSGEDGSDDVDGSDYGSMYDHERNGLGGHESHLDRVRSSQSARSRRGSNIYRTGTNILSTVRSRRPVPAFSHKLTNVPTTKDVIVDFDGPDDPYRPMNWSVNKKIMTTVLYGFTTMGMNHLPLHCIALLT